MEGKLLPLYPVASTRDQYTHNIHAMVARRGNKDSSRGGRLAYLGLALSVAVRIMHRNFHLHDIGRLRTPPETTVGYRDCGPKETREVGLHVSKRISSHLAPEHIVQLLEVVTAQRLPYYAVHIG
jgi:hypothetical protein